MGPAGEAGLQAGGDVEGAGCAGAATADALQDGLHAGLKQMGELIPIKGSPPSETVTNETHQKVGYSDDETQVNTTRETEAENSKEGRRAHETKKQHHETLAL